MLDWFAETALVTAAMAGVVALVCRIGRLGPAVRHALWLVVLLKLMTPPLLHWPWKIPAFPGGGRGNEERSSYLVGTGAHAFDAPDDQSDR